MAVVPVSNFIPAVNPYPDEINGVIQGGAWTPAIPGDPIVLTYTFYTDSEYSTSKWTDSDKANITQALEAWGSVANISFQQIEANGPSYLTSNADMAFTYAGDGGSVLGFALFPDPTYVDNEFLPEYLEDRTSYPNPEGDVFLFEGSEVFEQGGLNAGSFGFAVALHEIGHALGMKHPHDDGGNGRPLLPPALDNGYDTVMSYNDPQIVDNGEYVSYLRGFQSTPMPVDIRAFQLIYGANMTYHTGDDVYELRDDGKVRTIWDAGGIDMFDAKFASQGLQIDLREGELTRHGNAQGLSATAIAFDVVIENVYGSYFNDIITGNDANNTIDGQSGTDTMAGGMGDDTYYIDRLGDLVSENAGEGTDHIFSNVSFDLAASAVDVENLTLTGGAIIGSGTDDDNTITGTGGRNTLTGLLGNDVLHSGGGADTLIGGDGDDIYFVSLATARIFENAGEGVDTVNTSVNLTLGAELENLIITGNGVVAATGNALDNEMTGNDSKNTLSGQAGDDTLAGAGGNDTLFGEEDDDTLDGGAGFDTLNGGTGNDGMAGGLDDDLYIVDNAGDTVTEFVGEGVDHVQSSVSFSLTGTAAGIERLTLTGVDDIDATGNALNNTLIGNAGINTLDGGAGVDTMLGGAGDDFYVMDSSLDVITDTGGIDTVLTDITIDFPGYHYLQPGIENITLTGIGNVNARGGTGANVLTGNSGDNTLDGFLGGDTMIGGLGNDSYVVDSAGDIISELAAEGNDTVISALSWTLDANTENVLLTGSAVNATGNSGDNTLGGNAGLNTLNGGLGNDTYIVDARDVIVDAGGTDTVRVNFTYTLIAGMENLELSGTANIHATGNADNNTVTGNSGNNTLAGGLGNDTLQGGAGNGFYVVNDATETIVENPGEGSDTVLATVSHTLAAEVESLTLLGTSAINATGNAGDNTLTGNTAANLLTGGLGNDTYVIDLLDTIAVDTGGSDTVSFGGTYSIAARADLDNITLLGTGAFSATGNAGDNTLTGNSGVNNLNGGAGNDTYVIGKTDSIVDASGTDTVIAGFAYTLNTGLENLVLTGTAAMNGTGNAGVNTLTGNAGANTLDGLGGIDAYIGSLGNDVYIVDNSAETVAELAGQGTDTVRASVNYVLGAEVELLVLTGTAGVNGTGNALNNTLTGNAGDNTLDGGTGADLMQGGLGNDAYIVDHAGDIVKEAGGTDTMFASVTYTLASGVENLVLSGGGNINGTGNAAVNTLTGNTGDNTLDGGQGNDVMIGGAGNDTYIALAGDVVTELGGEGTDTVRASYGYTLDANVENLVLTGTSAVNGTGNSDDNIVTGNVGANTLSGLAGDDTLVGGSGIDTLLGGLDDDILIGGESGDVLTGGAGADVFVFSLGVRGIDTITDFVSGGGNDVLDIADVLVGYTGTVTDFVQLTFVGGNTILKVDANGLTGGSNFVQIATLTGVNLGTDEAALVTSGNLIVT